MSEELKLCDCGGSPMIVRHSEQSGVNVYVECRKCGAHGPRTKSNDEAVAAWNRNVTPPAAQVQGEQPEVVGCLLLGGHFSSEEMGDIDVDWDMKVAERLQKELVTTTDDVALPLMTVAQHERIVAALSAPHEHGELWAVHAEGPDDLYAAFSREDAERHANELNAIKVPDGISISAVVIPSPWGAVEHWQYLAEQEREHVESMRAALSAPPAAVDQTLLEGDPFHSDDDDLAALLSSAVGLLKVGANQDSAELFMRDMKRVEERLAAPPAAGVPEAQDE